MMKQSIPHWQIAGFLFTSVLGTFLHFLFELTGGSVFAALFSAVNESIWEHMKLIFYPMVLFALIEYRAWGKEVPDFWCTKLCGILLGLALIPLIYYVYTGILGVNADWFNVTIFFIAAAAAYYLETKMFMSGFSCRLGGKIAVAALCLIALIFTQLTFFPPRIPFFQDPLTGTYGYRSETKNREENHHGLLCKKRNTDAGRYHDGLHSFRYRSAGSDYAPRSGGQPSVCQRHSPAHGADVSDLREGIYGLCL